MGLMSKSGRLCSHCSPGALSKTLTGGSAGGRDPRRDQREWEGYWAHSPTHTSTHPSTGIQQKHRYKPTTCMTHTAASQRNQRYQHTGKQHHSERLFASPECACEIFLMQTNTQTHKLIKPGESEKIFLSLPPAPANSPTWQNTEGPRLAVWQC